MIFKPKYFANSKALSMIWTIVIAYPCRGQDEYDMSTSTEPETTTVELRCHIALGQWIPKLMEDANMCISDDPASYDRMKLRNSSVPLPPLNCIMRCAGMRLGIFRPDGTADVPAIINFIDENVIPQYKEVAYDVIASCAEFSNFGPEALNDPNCLAHGTLFKCFTNQGYKVVRLCALRVGISEESQPQPINDG